MTLKIIRLNKIDDNKDNALILIGANHVKNINLSNLKNINIYIFDDEKIKNKFRQNKYLKIIV